MEVVHYGESNTRVKELTASIPPLLEETRGRVALLDARMQQAVNKVRLVFTDSRNWAFEAAGGFSKIEISRNAIEILFTFCYAHIAIYTEVFAGRENLSGDLDLSSIPGLARPLKALGWVYAESNNASVDDMPADVPTPDSAAVPESIEEKAFNIALYAILFHLLHELAHLYIFDSRELTNEERFQQEGECDGLAVRWMKGMTSRDEQDLRRIRAGLAFGLCYVTAQSIDRKNHDGITHPKSYDRLVDVLQEFFDQDDDAWAFPFAILTGHMTNQGLLPLPPGVEPEKGFDRFYDGVQCYREVIRASDKK